MSEEVKPLYTKIINTVIHPTAKNRVDKLNDSYITEHLHHHLVRTETGGKWLQYFHVEIGTGHSYTIQTLPHEVRD